MNWLMFFIPFSISNQYHVFIPKDNSSKESVDTNLLIPLTIFHRIANHIFFFFFFSKPWDGNADTNEFY
jgi:hypothetical protein